jgi:hypothetical protein
MKKKYAIYGYVEYAEKMRTKNGIIEARFKGGNINRNAPLPATFETESAEVQRFVEGLPEYKDGVIRCVSVEEQESASDNVEKVEGVASLQAARAYLSEKYEITLDRVQTKKDILNVAKELGIEFPNIK